MSARPLWVLGDVHGELGRLRDLLARAGLTDRLGHWTGRNAVLVCVGDYVDRGPDGAGVVRTLARLEGDARADGGYVITLLGNHEPMMLAARQFGSSWRDARGRSFNDRWLGNRGRMADLLALTPHLLDWLRSRPAGFRVGPYLMLHADTLAYLRWGSTLRELNGNITAALHSDAPEVWNQLVRDLSERGAFLGDDGAEAVGQLTRAFGGQRLVHGHTPLAYVLDVEPHLVGGPLLYAGGRALNVDGGLTYHAEAGFITRLGPEGVQKVIRAGGS